MNVIVEMILYCPECHARHVDVGEFATKPHHTHACQACGFVWRPAKANTVGVQFLAGFKDVGLTPHTLENWSERVASGGPATVPKVFDLDIANRTIAALEEARSQLERQNGDFKATCDNLAAKLKSTEDEAARVITELMRRPATAWPEREVVTAELAATRLQLENTKRERDDRTNSFNDVVRARDSIVAQLESTQRERAAANALVADAQAFVATLEHRIKRALEVAYGRATVSPGRDELMDVIAVLKGERP